MKRSVFVALAIAAGGLGALPAGAATVYLKDGAEVECLSYRQEGSRVVVRLGDGEGDEIRLPLEEVDAVMTSNLVVAEPSAGPDDGAAPSDPSGTESLVAPIPFFGVRMPEDSTDCTPALRTELTAVYAKYNRAAAAGNFAEFRRHITARQARVSQDSLAGLDRRELQKRRKTLQETASKSYAPTACIVSPGNGTAAIAGRGQSIFNGELMDSHGTVSFKKEPDGWKVQTTVWNPSM